MIATASTEPRDRALFTLDSDGYNFALDAQADREYAPEKARCEAEHALQELGEACEFNRQVVRDRLVRLYPLIYREFGLSFEAWMARVANG